MSRFFLTVFEHVLPSYTQGRNIGLKSGGGAQKSGGLIWILFYTFLHAFDHIPRYLKATHYDEHGYHYFLCYIFFMETESVSEFTGSHDMEAIEKKNHN